MLCNSENDTLLLYLSVYATDKQRENYATVRILNAEAKDDDLSPKSLQLTIPNDDEYDKYPAQVCAYYSCDADDDDDGGGDDDNDGDDDTDINDDNGIDIDDGDDGVTKAKRFGAEKRVQQGLAISSMMMIIMAMMMILMVMMFV